jgi:hypothetical protein
MTANSFSSPDPASPSPNQDRRRVRRRWLIGGSIAVALVLIGSAAVYAGTTIADDREPESPMRQPGQAISSAEPAPTPSRPSPTPQGESAFNVCVEAQMILLDMIGVDVDYVETRRTAADRIRALAAPTSMLQAQLDELADELDAAAQMVEDDPTAEAEAIDREDAASLALIDSGECV